MLDMPILKFDKSIKYLEAQISVQKNNKQLILDIISNIGLILNNSSNNNDNLQSVLDKANEFLQNISSNITTLEQLNLEIKNITSDLNEIVYSKSKSTKTKEYYIAAFSNLKNNIVQYTQNFQNVENKLDIDNNAFNEFIKDNEFKYTFNESEDAESTYELASFSVNNESASVSADIEKQEINEDDIIDNGIEEAIASNEENIVEATTSEDFEIEDTSVENIENHETIEEEINIEELFENQTKESIEDIAVTEDIAEEQSDEIIEDVTVTEDVVEEQSDEIIEDIAVTEDVVEEQSDEIIEDIAVTEDVVEEQSEEVIEDVTVAEDVVEEQSEIIENKEVILQNPLESHISPVGELMDIFKEVLVNLYENKISEEEFKNTITELKNHLQVFNINNETPKAEPTIEENSTTTTAQNIIEEENQEPDFNEESLLEELLSEENEEISNLETTTSSENQNTQIESKPQSIEDIIKKIESAEDKNKILLISEKTNKIYLPYRITELQNYMDYYPNAYKSLADVVEQEFILDLDTFVKHPSKARYSETYNLIRNRSGKSILKAISYALKLKNKGNLDPAVIAACKSEYELHCYLYCLEQNKFDSFKFFNIIYDVNLL